ncbi:MAG: hypothetical protein ACRELE_03245, partial [Gemmatimonadales bacterium]
MSPHLPTVLVVGLASLGVAASTGKPHRNDRAGPRFEISFARSAHSAPITGRIYLALSRTNDVRRTPIDQTGETGVPLFGVNVENLAPGQAAVIDATTPG